MDKLIETPAVVIFGLFINILVLIIRTCAEIFFPVLSRKTEPGTPQYVWEKIVLVILPVLLGGLLGLGVHDAPFYPEVLVDHSIAMSRMIFGAVCGFFASDLYRVASAAMKLAQGKAEAELPPKDPTT